VRRVLVAAILLASLGVVSSAAAPAAMAGVSSRVSRSTGCAAPTPSYPGSRLTDCVAQRDSRVFVDGTVVTARWSLTADEFGFTNLCAAVSIRNQNTSSYFFNDFNMTVRPPTGRVRVLNFTAKRALNDGFIAPGGVARGNICFDYFGESGRYVAMYSPRPGSAIRGIWLIHVT
jgi:hypothetical protein